MKDLLSQGTVACTPQSRDYVSLVSCIGASSIVEHDVHSVFCDSGSFSWGVSFLF